MRSAADFYQGLHTSQKTYSAGSYHLESLYSSRALNRWLGERRDKPMRLLDVGCGKGLFLRDFVGTLKSRWQLTPARIVGLDLVRSPDDLFPEISERFEFVQHDTDGNPLPFAAGSFDFLCCNHVLEHVDNPVLLLEKMKTWINPKGKIIIIVPNKESVHRQLAVTMGMQPELDTLGARDKLVGHQRLLHP